MHPLTCPECRASLDAEAIERTSVWECPDCGQPLPDVQEKTDSVALQNESLTSEIRISVTPDREPLAVRWHIGPLGMTRTLPFADIANIRKTIPEPEDLRPPLGKVSLVTPRSITTNYQ